ncbi:PD-(D/E)XK motif protein [Aeromonas salmonicida]|uniref:PD-(D/E)XK motif protein n=1 Tax=Aeromonas salmonicida TaxID=645 RepID=UPI003BB5E0F2
MKTSKIKSIWEAVKSEAAGSGFRRVDVEHILDFYAGVDSLGRFTLLLISQKNPNVDLELQSVKIHTVIREDGQWSLLFILEKPELFELFLLFCEDLISSSRLCVDKSKGLPFVLARLVSWRLLFERGNLEILTEVQVRGLSGELLHLQSLIETINAPAAVKSWKGPDRADQDFQFEKLAWEVKTVWPSVSEVKIASERQLDYTHRALQLVVVQLGGGTESTENGFTLNQLVDGIREQLKSDFETYSAFENSLLRYGYSTNPEYDNYVMILYKITCYKVDAGFPCLRPQDLPSGLSHVNYKLCLNSCKSFQI